MRAYSLQLLITAVALVTVAAGRKLSRPQAAAVIGYKTHKGGPVVSLHDKQNIIVGDQDNPDDPEEDNDTYRISADGGRRTSTPKHVLASEERMMGLMTSLSERVAALQHTLTNIKLQNHLIYRTMKKGYKICEQSTNDHNIKVAAQKIEKPKCPLGYVINSDINMCYKLVSERITWRMARERCLAEDSDLVTIETKMEQRWLNQVARQNPDTRHCDFWTGATDKDNEGDWRWVANNNALSYSNWNHNEPNNGRGDEHCMQMLWVFNWAWNDARCNYNNACYICEVPLRKY